jgi:peptide alpha-N-acetyltransferase
MSAFSNEQPDQDLIYVSYSDEEMMPDVQRLVSADLSEPYSVFVYRYFLNQWPELCICAYTIDPDTKDKGKMIAVIVCKAEKEQDDIFRGYIAMLAVNKDHRKKGLGLKLANMGIDLMVRDSCSSCLLFLFS